MTDTLSPPSMKRPRPGTLTYHNGGPGGVSGSQFSGSYGTPAGPSVFPGTGPRWSLPGESPPGVVSGVSCSLVGILPVLHLGLKRGFSSIAWAAHRPIQGALDLGVWIRLKTSISAVVDHRRYLERGERPAPISAAGLGLREPDVGASRRRALEGRNPGIREPSLGHWKTWPTFRTPP